MLTSLSKKDFQAVFISTITMDKIVNHLNYVISNDKRKREILRAKLALRAISNWSNEAEKLFKENFNDKGSSFIKD